jgi:hypothetical protein
MMTQFCTVLVIGLLSLLTDVAPPVGPIVALSAGVLAVIGCGVVIVVVVAILVIRAIRKNRGPKNPA